MPLAHAELPAADEIDSQPTTSAWNTLAYLNANFSDASSDEWRQFKLMVQTSVGSSSIEYAPVFHVERVQSPGSVVFSDSPCSAKPIMPVSWEGPGCY